LLGLETFREAAKEADSTDVHLEQWRESFYSKHTGDSPETKRKAFVRVRKDLVELGKLFVKDDVYTERDTGQSGTFAGHVPLVTLNERDKAGHIPIGMSRCPACVPDEDDGEEKGKCPAVVLPDKEVEKKEPVLLSGGNPKLPADHPFAVLGLL